MTRPYQTHPEGKSRTRQSHAADCDINNIIKKFQKTGALDHVAKHGGHYGDATSMSYHEAMTLVTDAQVMFEELPSSARAKFENDPEQFMDFVQDDANLEEMDTLGLLNDEASIRLETQRVAAKAAPPEPEIPDPPPSATPE